MTTRYRLAGQVSADLLMWSAGLWLAHAVRYDFALDELVPGQVLLASTVAGVAQVLLGALGHLYRGRYRYGSSDEVLGVLLTVGCTAFALGVVNLLWGAVHLPRSVPFSAGLLAFTGMVGVRYAYRRLRQRRRRPTAGRGAEPLLLFGAGEGAEQVLTSILGDPRSRWLPVALLDDDVRKRNLRLRGVRVVGGRNQLAAAAASTGASALLVAIPSADAQLLREVSELAEAIGLSVKVLPTVDELIDGRAGLDDIRDLDLNDLLGRRSISLDLESIAGYLTGKRVLVTGAGGSIGSELCRQLVKYAPAELMMLDRDESALHAVQLSISGRALLDGDDLLLADLRDPEHISRLFQQRRPQVVFHAAALKHLTLLERHPGEAVKSNVWGSLTVLQAAEAAGVERFVNISTDKAADPESVLGYSKRIAERLTAHVAQDADGRYLSVRFGNVLGSRGSVLTAFTAQIQAGGPITVTHPDVTRYFMTVQEAVQLVIQAAAVGNDGEVLVLDMGKPVRIDEVAHRLAEKSTRPVEVVYTGLRPGEKLHEDLLGADEVDTRPMHPLISQVPVPPVTPEDVLALDPWATDQQVCAQLARLAALPPTERVPTQRAAVAGSTAPPR